MEAPDSPARTRASVARRRQRMAAIPDMIPEGAIVTADHLAEKLGVTTRTIYRYMADLGDPRIRGEGGIGYMMRRRAA